MQGCLGCGTGKVSVFNQGNADTAGGGHIQTWMGVLAFRGGEKEKEEEMEGGTQTRKQTWKLL